MWNPNVESMPQKDMQTLQLERLKNTVSRVYENVPAYKKKFDASGVKPADIKTLQDLQKLPFTTKEDLRQNYPFGMFAVPMPDVVRIHSSSGTTGKPTVVGYTRNDIQIWAEVMARTIGCAGGTRNDVVQVTYGYGLFTGGLGVHYGAELMGCTTIPISGGNSKRQVMIMEDFGTTILACTPSYALALAEVLFEEQMDRSKLKLRAGIFGAEPWTNEMRDELEKRWGILALDIYGLSETIGPGVSSECDQKCGLHINEDHFIPEVINPETGETLPDGELGELVFTCVTKEAFPVIRYRTRDLSRLFREPCACGRTTVRMERVSGRTDDMLIIRGVNVFPSQIESVLVKIEGAEPHYLIVVDRVGALDDIEVQVELSERAFSDEVRKVEELRARIAGELYGVLGLHAKVKLVEPKCIERSMGKARRVIDKRKGEA